MSVLKRGNSKFWYIQFQFQGKTYIRSSRTIIKRIAEQMELDWKSKLHAQQFLGQKERIGFFEALDQFCESKKGTPNYLCLNSHVRTLAQHFPKGKFLDDLTLQDLERLKRDRTQQGISAQTMKHTFNVIRGAWKYAKRTGYQVADLEIPQVKIPKYRLRYLSEDEERKLLKELDPKREGKGLKPFEERCEVMKRTMQDAYDLVILLLDTGARYSEIANIRWDQINLDEKVIHLWRPKVQNEAYLFMTDRAYQILRRRAQAKAGDHVFTSKKGGPRGYASQAIRKAMKRAGLNDCTIHTFRHTHASRLIQNGMSVYEVKEILGHTDIKTTMRYAHLERKDVTSKARDVINRLNKEMEKPVLTIIK
jgi:integrase